MKPSSRRTQEERNAVAREKLSQAALELFAIKGFDSTSLADIGVRAGYSRGLAQYHYGSKTRLAEELLDDMGQRDLRTHMLKLPPDADGAYAWQQLEKHLEDSWKNFCAMHDGSDSNLAARGEMILNVHAIFSQDPALREKINALTRILASHVSRILRICIRDNVIRNDIDPNTVALFYVTSIWGMVNALFADPENSAYFSGLVDTLKRFMNTLRD
jgi:AcrR family transcriptional regulator